MVRSAYATPRWFLVAVVVAGLLAGCTASDGPRPTPTSERSEDGRPTSSPTERATTPEEDLLDLFSAEQDLAEEQIIAQGREFQEGVAECMREAGFEYTPNIPTQSTSVSDDDNWNEEWAATYGFGISIETVPTAPLVPDPNADYVASLSEEGREAYRIALEGEPWDGVSPPDTSPEALGCYLTVSEQVSSGERPPGPPALVQDLWTEIARSEVQKVATDPRMADAAQALVTCVVDAGGSSFDPLGGGGSAGVDFGGGLVDLPIGESAYDQVDRAYQELLAGGEPSEAELAEFQQWERDIAVAWYRCSAAMNEVREEIHDETVREVVGPHRAELEALAEVWAED